MINISSDIICTLIMKIREFQAKEEVVLPEDPPNPSDDTDWSQVLADHKDDLTYQEIESTINDLEPDQQLTLVALIFLGRGDYDKYIDALNEAQNVELNQIVHFILTTPLAADYMEEAINQLGYECDV